MLIFSISPLSLAIWDAWVPDPSYIVKKSQHDSVCNWKNAYNVRNRNTLFLKLRIFENPNDFLESKLSKNDEWFKTVTCLCINEEDFHEK